MGFITKIWYAICILKNCWRWQKSDCLQTLFDSPRIFNFHFLICILLFKHFPSIKSNLLLQLHLLEFPTRRQEFALSVPVHCWCAIHISFNSLPATIKQFRQNQWMNFLKQSYKFNRRIVCIAICSSRLYFQNNK